VGFCGLEPLLCDKCHITFSYIHTNTTKLVLYFSHLIPLDCFTNALIDKLLLKKAILAEICRKMLYFYEKITKIDQRWELRPRTAPRSPMASGGWRLCSKNWTWKKLDLSKIFPVYCKFIRDATHERRKRRRRWIGPWGACLPEFLYMIPLMCVSPNTCFV